MINKTNPQKNHAIQIDKYKQIIINFHIFITRYITRQISIIFTGYSNQMRAYFFQTCLTHVITTIVRDNRKLNKITQHHVHKVEQNYSD